MINYIPRFYRWMGATLLSGVIAVSAHAQETVCAQVVIQIEQELTLEREGFEARLGITNGLPAPLTDFQVTLHFTDADGNLVPVATEAAPDTLGARFFYRLQTGYTQPASVDAGVAEKVAYLIVPTPGSAGESAEGSRYYVGATIRYMAAGKQEIVELAPDSITVRPMPDLQLQYFLPGDVFADDPLTDPVEPIVPFPLGVRVTNHSEYATARKLKIQSGQPEIVENEQGLLIDFRIIGSTVNGAPAQPTLLADLGNIAPRAASVGEWLMTTTLSGKFVRFTAEVAHAPDLGGALTSLIPEDAISTHRLLGQVVADLPGRDAVPDFLATDAMVGSFLTVKLYGSDNDEVSEAVTYFAPGSGDVSLTPAGGSNPAYTLTLATGTELGYVRMVSPISADKQVKAVRSDGKVLPAANSWISRTRAPETGVISYWLNVFDTTITGGQTYTLTFTDPAQINQAPELTLNGSDFTVSPGKTVTIIATATDPNGTIPVLTTGLLPDGATFADAHAGQGTLVWSPTATQLGSYSVLVRASDGQLTTTRTARIHVTETTASGFDAWAEAYWPDETDPAVVGAGADPDRDGLDNLLEYALDANPTIADDSMLPVISLEKIGADSFLTLTYRRRTDDTALVYAVVASDAVHAPLADWIEQTTVLSESEPDAVTGLKTVRIRDSVPVSSGHRYLRLRVSKEDIP